MVAISLNQKNPAGPRSGVFAASGEATFVFLCITLAFVIRLFFVKYQYVINTDGVYYATLGRRLISGDFRGGFSTYWSPLYPLLVGLASLWFSDLEFAGRFVSLLAGALLVLPVYLLIREFYGRSAATVGALLAVIYPILIQISTLLMTESVYTLAFTSALLIGWYGLKDGGAWKYAATGLLMGCCYLLKPEAVAYPGLFVVLALGSRLIDKDRPLRDLTFNVVVFLVAFSVLALPYVVYVRAMTGSWSISSKVVNNLAPNQSPLSLSTGGDSTLWDQLYGDGVVVPPPTSVSAPGASPSSRTVLERLRLHAQRSYRNLKTETKEMIPEIVPYSFIVLCIIGFFRSAWTRLRAAKELYLAAFVGATLMGYAVTVVDTRYLMPLVPVFLGWISQGALEFESWVVSTLSHFNVGLPRPPVLRMGVLTVLMLVLLPSLVGSTRKSRWDDLPIEQKQAGLWLKGRPPASPVILANGPWAAYYAGGRHLYLPAEPYATVLSYAKRKGVDYLVVGARCETAENPNSPPELCIRNTPLAFLMDETQAPPELQLLYKEADRPEFKLLVYGFKNPDEPSSPR
jgi:4-amino-4-deoxy-L-arabinose transferase-like glycosyltransferase